MEIMKKFCKLSNEQLNDYQFDGWLFGLDKIRFYYDLIKSKAF